MWLLFGWSPIEIIGTAIQSRTIFIPIFHGEQIDAVVHPILLKLIIICMLMGSIYGFVVPYCVNVDKIVVLCFLCRQKNLWRDDLKMVRACASTIVNLKK